MRIILIPYSRIQTNGKLFMLNPFSPLKAAGFRPSSLVAPNPWVGHLPFAYWIIGSIKPSIFVELGTHSGNSYFAFCQAAKELHLTTKCYAVDTWQGDLHAGDYDNSIFNNVNEHNQLQYSKFSHLLRMTFDQALDKFPNQSIDLLHIDGLHTYEAVKHDFETWLPKLKPNAIVLFHDTSIRDHGFGVWKFWAELQTKYNSHISFSHSKGLGVLCLQEQINPSLATWLGAQNFTVDEIRDYFTSLGNRQLEVFNLQQEELEKRLAHEVELLTKELSSRDSELSELRQWIFSWKKLLARGFYCLARRLIGLRNEELVKFTHEHKNLTKKS